MRVLIDYLYVCNFYMSEDNDEFALQSLNFVNHLSKGVFSPIKCKLIILYTNHSQLVLICPKNDVISSFRKVIYALGLELSEYIKF